MGGGGDLAFGTVGGVAYFDLGGGDGGAGGVENAAPDLAGLGEEGEGEEEK